MALLAHHPSTTSLPHTHLNPQHMSTQELGSLATSLAKQGQGQQGTQKFDALTALAAKPPSVKELLQQRIEFVEGKKGGDKEDEIPYEPINVKVPPGVFRGPSTVAPSSPTSSSSSSSSTDDSPDASSSRPPPSSSSTTSAAARVFPPIDTSVSWPSSRPVGAGLQNQGNTCFLNSALQCLLHTPPLVRWLESTAHPMGCDMHRKKGFCMICSMKWCVKQSFGSQKRAYSPTFVTKNLKAIAKHFRFGRQEDSHEFLRFAIDAMQAGALYGKGKLPSSIAAHSPLHQLFGGRLRSRVAAQCGHNSDTYDHMLDLSLDLNRADSVNDALKNLVKSDKLTGGNKYKCEKCKKLVNAEKRFTIEDAPLVLTIHLKRFTPLGKKIGGVVKYQETLKLGPFMSDSTQNPTYRLYALIEHSGGGPHSGHYTAYVKSAQGKWHDMNDESVSGYHGQGAPTNMRNAYVLFYMREKGEALRSAIGAGVGAGAGATGGAQQNGKRARESVGGAGAGEGAGGGSTSAAGTPVKRVKPDQQPQQQQQPFGGAPRRPEPGPPTVLTASKTASPRLSTSSVPSATTLSKPNPFLFPTPTPKPAAAGSSAATSTPSTNLTAPIPAKQFVSRVPPTVSTSTSTSTASPSSAAGPSPFTDLATGATSGSKKKKQKNKDAASGGQGGGGLVANLGRKAQKKAVKMKKRELMGLTVPDSTGGEKGGKNGGGGGGGKNRPRVLQG